MTRTLTCLAVGMATLLAAGPRAGADDTLPMRSVDCMVLRQLPAIRLVVRDEDTLMKMGVAGMIEIDFKKEMGLFVSLGPEKCNLAAITVKAVRKADDKLVVEMQEYGFTDLLKAEGDLYSYQFVVVPASTLPVEGFVDEILPCPGLCAVSTLMKLKGKVAFKAFCDKAKARGYATGRVSELNPMIKRLGWLHSVAWDVGPDADPKGICCRFQTVKSGGGAQCYLEYLRARYVPPSRERLRQMTSRQRDAIVCPADEARIAAGLVGAYGIPPALSKKGAKQVTFGYVHYASRDEGMTDIGAIRKSDVNAETFRKYVKSDGKTFVTSGGNFIDTVDEVGQHGTLRWKKPYAKAEKEIDGVGRVTMAINELGLFQIRIENVKTTDVEELRRQTKKLARRVGCRFDDEVLEAARFSFCVPYGQ